jgi:hypothetical protein
LTCPTESEEVVSTALGGDLEFRGIRTPSPGALPLHGGGEVLTDEAIDLANDSPSGLGGGDFHSDTTVVLDVANRLDTGMVVVKAAEGGGPELPFGGTTRSGVGGELGPYGVEELLSRKLIHGPAAD